MGIFLGAGVRPRIYRVFSKDNCMNRVVISVFIFLVVGCGSQDHRTYPVHGKVLFGDGSPMPGETIEFRNVSQGDAAIIASGIVAEDGTFELITFGNKQGAVAGMHRVIVSPKRTPPPAVPGPGPPPTTGYRSTFFQLQHLGTGSDRIRE